MPNGVLDKLNEFVINFLLYLFVMSGRINKPLDGVGLILCGT